MNGTNPTNYTSRTMLEPKVPGDRSRQFAWVNDWIAETARAGNAVDLALRLRDQARQGYGAAMRSLRLERQRSLRSVATDLGVSKTMLSDFERGLQWSETLAVRLARLLGPYGHSESSVPSGDDDETKEGPCSPSPT